MNGKILRISVIAAILAGIFYFFNSTLNLLGYALSNGFVTAESNKIIETIVNNYRALNVTFISILLLACVTIYLSFIHISKNTKSKFLMISSILMLASSFIFLFFSLLTVLNYQLPASISMNYYKIENYSGILFLFFGITLLISKLDSQLSKVLGAFYIIESIILMGAIFLPIKLAEFTVALRVLEAFFFYNESKKPINKRK